MGLWSLQLRFWAWRHDATPGPPSAGKGGGCDSSGGATLIASGRSTSRPWRRTSSCSQSVIGAKSSALSRATPARVWGESSAAIGYTVAYRVCFHSVARAPLRHAPSATVARITSSTAMRSFRNITPPLSRPGLPPVRG